MGSYALKDFAVGTLAAGIAAGATSLTLGSGEGGKFPSTFNFLAVIYNDSDFPDKPFLDPAVEVITCTAKAGDVLTINATANAHNTGGKTYKLILAPVTAHFIGAANTILGTDSGATKLESKAVTPSGPVTVVHTPQVITIGANTPRQQTFGMELISGPDSDKLSTQMMLRRAKWITMNDGRLLVPNPRRVLDKSLSVGVIGGWQATPAVDTMNKVYYLAKSTDLPDGVGGGSDGLFAVRAKDYFNDTSFSTTSNAGRALRLSTGTATDRLAQGIIFTTAGPLRYLILNLTKNNSPTGNAWVSLYSDSAGSPSTLLKTSRKFDVSLLTSTETLVLLIFDDPYSVLTATQYHAVLEGDYTKSDTINISWRGVAAGGYASGVAKEYNGTTWANASGVGDFLFRVGVERNDTAIVPPSGYDLYAHVGWAPINAAGNLKRCRQTDQRLETFKGADWKIATVSSTTLFPDLQTFIPPSFTRCRFVVGNDAANRHSIGHHSAINLGNNAVVPGGTDAENVVNLIAVAGNDADPGGGCFPLIGLEVQRAFMIAQAESGVWLNDFEWTPE
jgi:hypothetical protein